ncbi:MAG: hypothetical protein Q8L86_02965 [Vicinamibacterales bacterium]|nr:hypothetical protein [Vicinamibacterales bacterium]
MNAPADLPGSPDLRRLRVLAPDARRLTEADVRHMLGGVRPHHARGGGLERGRQMVALCGDDVVGVAAFELEEADLFVHVLAAAPPAADVIAALVGALELACLAAGGRRVALTAHADVAPGILAGLGYEAGEARAGWLTRRLT